MMYLLLDAKVMSNQFKGRVGEDMACDFLLEKGYKILKRNHREGRAEIDVIAQDGHYLVFVEVKSRKNNKYGYPEEGVSKEQFTRISNAAQDYLGKVKWPGPFRFDIISITYGEDPELFHLEDVFY